jgi:hypothetical protein
MSGWHGRSITKAYTVIRGSGYTETGQTPSQFSCSDSQIRLDIFHAPDRPFVAVRASQLSVRVMAHSMKWSVRA